MESFREFKDLVVDKFPYQVVFFSSVGHVLYANEAFCRVMGYTREETTQLSISDINLAVAPNVWYQHWNKVAKQGSSVFSTTHRVKNGQSLNVEVYVFNISHKTENLICGVFKDVSDSEPIESLAKYTSLMELVEERGLALQDGRTSVGESVLKIFNSDNKDVLSEIKSLKNRIENRNESVQEDIGRNANFSNILHCSNSYKKVLTQVDQVAVTDTTVLITGESGTGKELLASAIHSNSRRNSGPLIKINCATLPKELMESELFGHKKGAFTGAVVDKMGKFALANGGTIFLDEIGELPVELQPKLLRVLQEGEFDEVGGTKTIKVNVRIIAATNRDLKDMMRKGLFREDLYYRLNVFPIYNIPLRSRKEDIPLLAQFFLEKYSAKACKDFKRLSSKTIEYLMGYDFPGNIRELENLIERAVIVENGTILGPGSWMPKKDVFAIKNEFKSFEAKQREYIIDVLEYTNWRISGPNGASAILEMNDKTLFAKMKRLGIERQVSLKSQNVFVNN